MKKYEGNVALIAVVSMIAIALAGTFALTISSVNYKLSTIGFIASTNLEQEIHSCKEEASRKISKDNSFEGIGTITFTNGSCTYTISIDGGNSNHRNVVINSDYASYYKTKTVKFDISTNPISEL